MSKYIVSIDTPSQPTIREFDEDEARDILRDEMREEIAEEMQSEFQNAVDEKFMELDNMIGDLVSRADDLTRDASKLRDDINDLDTETVLNLEDYI